MLEYLACFTHCSWFCACDDLAGVEWVEDECHAKHACVGAY